MRGVQAPDETLQGKTPPVLSNTGVGVTTDEGVGRCRRSHGRGVGLPQLTLARRPLRAHHLSVVSVFSSPHSLLALHSPHSSPTNHPKVTAPRRAPRTLVVVVVVSCHCLPNPRLHTLPPPASTLPPLPPPTLTLHLPHITQTFSHAAPSDATRGTFIIRGDAPRGPAAWHAFTTTTHSGIMTLPVWH